MCLLPTPPPSSPNLSPASPSPILSPHTPSLDAPFYDQNCPNHNFVSFKMVFQITFPQAGLIGNHTCPLPAPQMGTGGGQRGGVCTSPLGSWLVACVQVARPHRLHRTNWSHQQQCCPPHQPLHIAASQVGSSVSSMIIGKNLHARHELCSNAQS